MYYVLSCLFYSVSFFLPVVKQLTFQRFHNGAFRLDRINHLGKLKTVEFFGVPFIHQSRISPNEIIYYGANYSDYHSSNLFIMAFNLEKIFTCIAGKDIVPTCARFTAEEDGFNKGKSIVEAGDSGNDFIMFGKGKRVYAFSVSGCPLVTNACFPLHYMISITCLLPREYCAK